jgi:two-component system cell cycle response regulator
MGKGQAMPALFSGDFAPDTPVLVAEDDLVTRMMLSATLSDWGLKVVEAENGNKAMEILSSPDTPRLALLDWNMPGQSGLEVCRTLRAGPAEPYIYVILLTSMNKAEDIVTGLDAGADDYLVKPYNPAELRVRLKAGDRIVRLQAELIEARERLRDQANRDPMTGLFNRRAIQRKYRDRQEDPTEAGQPLSALLVDIDHFKLINDTHGHDVGDIVIVEVGRRLRETVGALGLVSRYGGEEFLVIFPRTPLEEAEQIAARLRMAIRSTPVDCPSGLSVALTASMGLACTLLSPEKEIEEVVKVADEALYRAKQGGRDQVVSAQAPAVG